MLNTSYSWLRRGGMLTIIIISLVASTAVKAQSAVVPNPIKDDIPSSHPQQVLKAELDSWPALPTLPDILRRFNGATGAWPAIGPAGQFQLSPPTNDPLRDLPNEGNFRGTLVYVPRVLESGGGPATQRFVMRGVGLKRTMGAQSTSVVTYLASAGSDVFSPNFSPDGRYIVYGDGNLSFVFYLWDLSGKKVRRINSEFSTLYPWVSWSPSSTYLAYVLNADSSGAPVAPDEPEYPVQILVHSVRDGTNQMVVESPLLANPLGPQYQGVTPLAWTKRNSLLFSKLPTSSAADKEITTSTRAALLKRPAIYEASIGAGETKLIAKDAFNPTPSPDGKWIAFFGWPLPSPHSTPRTPQEERVNNLPGVYLLDLSNAKRVLIRPLPLPSRQQQAPPMIFMRWTPDSRQLVLVESKRIPPERKNDNGQITTEVHISALDIPPLLVKVPGNQSGVQGLATVLIKEVATFRAEGYTVQDVSQDGTFLFIKVHEGAQQVAGIPTIVESLQAVNLHNGAMSVIARFYSDSRGRIDNFGWHQEVATLVENENP